jgi:hypothetical protein
MSNASPKTTMRFFFAIPTGDTAVADSEGVELTSSEEAQHEAVLAAREMMAERLRRGQSLGGHRRFVIRDGRGSVISGLQFCDAIPMA